jgi:hypothetical protein
MSGNRASRVGFVSVHEGGKLHTFSRGSTMFDCISVNR